MTTDKAIEVANKIQLSDNPLWLEIKRLVCDYEKQIVESEQKLEQAEKDLADYQFNYPTIKELQKENAELKEKLEGAEKARDYWKDSSFDWRHKCTSRKPFKVAVKAQKQLTKAKDLLAKWVELFKPKLDGFPKPPIQEKTEQFLKENKE